MRGEDLSSLRVHNLLAQQAKIHGTNLTNATFVLSDLSNSEIFPSSAAGSNYLMSNLSGAVIRIPKNENVGFSGSILTGAKLLLEKNSQVEISASALDGTEVHLDEGASIFIDRSDFSKSSIFFNDTDSTPVYDAAPIGAKGVESIGNEATSFSGIGDAMDGRKPKPQFEEVLAAAVTTLTAAELDQTCVDLSADDCVVDLRFRRPPEAFFYEFRGARRSFAQRLRYQGADQDGAMHWKLVHGVHTLAADQEHAALDLPRIIRESYAHPIAKLVNDDMAIANEIWSEHEFSHICEESKKFAGADAKKTLLDRALFFSSSADGQTAAVVPRDDGESAQAVAWVAAEIQRRRGTRARSELDVDLKDSISALVATVGAHESDIVPRLTSNNTSESSSHEIVFAWPVDGRIISKFGRYVSWANGVKKNDGVNIAAPEGTEVRAAADGVVVYEGTELEGYGKLLLVKHADNFVTAYAHNSEILVREGDHVRIGQSIARVGQSGSAAEPQLHFEIRRNLKALDPEELLRECASLDSCGVSVVERLPSLPN